MPGLTRFETAEILGVHPWGTYQLANRQGWAIRHERRRPVDQATVEAHTVSLNRLRDGSDFWLTVEQAAEEQWWSRSNVQRLIELERLPALRHKSGRWLLRRPQVEVIANARESRVLRGVLM